MTNFDVSLTGDRRIEVKFKRKNDFTAVRQLEFFSRLLHSLRPNENNIWVEGSRLDFYIFGFPRAVSWTSPETNLMVGNIQSGSNKEETKIVEDLKWALGKYCPTTEEFQPKIYEFSITNDREKFDYSFNTRARTVCVLGVLFDLEWHPRQNLEVWINPDLTDKIAPGKEINASKAPQQYYGDPSKTADVLRNEGWTREGSNPKMHVEPRLNHGQSQQFYKITQRAQPVATQVQRSNIRPQWRTSLFEEHRFRCQICLADFEDKPEYLSPDHRVPVIFEADSLTDDNFLEKLMTLCRFCNQSKREFAKRVPADYDWRTSPWAFPEKYRLFSAARQVKEMHLISGESIDKVLAKLTELLASDA